MQITLWLVRETDKARLYCKHGRPNPEESDMVWVKENYNEPVVKAQMMLELHRKLVGHLKKVEGYLE